MTRDIFDYKLELLVKEWDYIQSHIGRYDTIVFSIRGWAVSAFTAMLAVSASQKLPDLMLFAMLPVLMFWLIDALHKSFQRNFIQRGREIENYLASSRFTDDVKARSGISLTGPALSEGFGKGSLATRINVVLENALVRNVLMTYSAMLILCALSYFVLLLAKK